MDKVVLNIPHSGIVIPEWAVGDITIPSNELASLVCFMTDKDVDKLWEFAPVKNKQIATVSRLIVDIERYRNDADETMSLKGMGLYYTHTPDGKTFRLRTEDTYLKCLDIYDDYHASLEAKVSECVALHEKCILLDCHSFHDKMSYTGYAPGTFPDVCIGVNGSITEEAQYVIDTFKSAGYTVKINEPFAGSLVPLKYLNDIRVTSIMIELNRRIYDNDAFDFVQNICKTIYQRLNR